MPSHAKARLHLKVRESILQLIRSGELGPDRRLPSEQELAARWGVSRVTVREALSLLEQEGVLYREQGNGTFAHVEIPPIVYDLGSSQSLSALIRRVGLEPGVSQQRVQVRPAELEEVRRLGVAPGDPVVEFVRVRTASGRPVVYTIDVIPKRFFGKQPVRELEGSLYDYLEKTLGQRIRSSTVIISIEYADEERAEALRVPFRTPLLHVDQVDFNSGGEPVVASREWYLKDVFQFRLVRDRGRE